MGSPTWWRWVWASSGSWWWTGKPVVLQSMEWRRVGHDWVTELNWLPKDFYLFLKKYLLIWLCQVLVAGCGIIRCGLWYLVLWPGIEPGPPALRMWSLGHWTTGEVPSSLRNLDKGPVSGIEQRTLQRIRARCAGGNLAGPRDHSPHLSQMFTYPTLAFPFPCELLFSELPNHYSQ